MSVWQQASDLTDRTLEVTSGLDLPRGDLWPTVVTVFLVQANERLDAIRLLLDNNYWDSAVILARSLFELAANLTYLSNDISANLHRYLQHGGIPVTAEEADKLQARIERDEQSEVKNIVPGQVWKL